VTAAKIPDRSRLREPAHTCTDPWAIVHMIAADLAAHGIKSRFGAEADFGQAATAAAALLSALDVRPLVRDDDDPAAPGDDDAGVTSAAPYPLSLDIRADTVAGTRPPAWHLQPVPPGRRRHRGLLTTILERSGVRSD
jgi:hypothetical protein